ncbi:MAG TPA: hypothetical protein VMX94_11985 [Armatimonadota bacterium]|nr:hypothetical protein [Armatimonadota bacterium]
MINFTHLKQIMEAGDCLWYAAERLVCVDKALLLQLPEADYKRLVEWHVEIVGEHQDAHDMVRRVWERNKNRKGVQAETRSRVHKQYLRLSAPGILAYVGQYYAQVFERFDELPLWITGEREPVQITDKADKLVGLLMVCDLRKIEKLA